MSKALNKKEALSLGVFLVSLFLLGFLFFSSFSTAIAITLADGEVIEQEIPATFSMITTLSLMLLTVIATISLFYFTSDFSKKLSLSRDQKLRHALLEGDEKVVYEFLLEKGECLQKDLVYELKLPKTRVTRILDKMEQKNIIVRVSYGNTNKIVVKE